MTAPTALLIVDDNAAEVVLMTRLAENAFPGLHVKSAADAQGAHDACRSSSFNCVILDYNMPGTDGLTCAKELRALYPFLPLVLCTHFGDEMLAAHAVTSGVSDYIPKSRMSASALSRAISNAIKITQLARTIDEQRIELETFAYALAHDFKQPIRQIRTFSGLLEGGLGANPSEDAQKYLGFLNAASRRLGDLVDVMSEYALLGKLPVIGPVKPLAVLANVQHSLGAYIEERGGIVKCGEGPLVRGSEALLGQVFQNLIVNALKYNVSKTPTVSIEFKRSAGRCIVSVRDNGIGIPPQHLEEVFKPLARLHSSAEYTGTGLGLTLVRKAVRQMGGDIFCRSTVGSGSEFTFELDLAAA